jgi:hypothetical protein
MRREQAADRDHIQPPHPRDPWRLVEGGGNADFRIQAARRRRHQVNGDGCAIARIGRLQRLDATPDRVQ